MSIHEEFKSLMISFRAEIMNCNFKNEDINCPECKNCLGRLEVMERVKLDLEKRQWISVEDEEIPKDKGEILVANARQAFVKTMVSWNPVHGYWQTKGKAIPVLHATHWMLIPDLSQS